MRHIVLVGNCQIQALISLYARFAGQRANETFTYIKSYADLAKQDRAAVANADLFVEQVSDFPPKADVAGIELRGERVGVPLVNGGFLWPFAGQAHPRNDDAPDHDSPYGAEASDAWLNRMIKRGTAPETAVDAYEKLDVNKTMSLDRLLEITLEKQQNRDRMTGFRIAELIAEHFRSERVFLTPYHPDARISVELAAQFFAKLGVDPADTARMRRAVRVTPFPKEELPVHPAVARHFGMTWAHPERRYRFAHEGAFTWREYMLRYMNFAWNRDLAEGLALVHQGKLVAARPKLVAGLAVTPAAASGHAALSHVLDRQGEPDAALEAAKAACALAPEHASNHAHLGSLLARRGELVAAEHAYWRAIAADPFEPHHYVLLSHLLRQQKRAEEAVPLMQLALANYPHSAKLHIELGNGQLLLGDGAAAEHSFRQALALEPTTAACVGLADALDRQDRPDAAIAALRQAQALEPGNAHLLGRLATALRRGGRADEAAQELAAAEAACRRIIAAFPDAAVAHAELSRILDGQGRKGDALAAAQAAVAADPASPEHLVHLAGLAAEAGDLPGAVATLRRAVALAPRHAHAWGQLGRLLSALGEHDEAIAARRASLAIDPDNIDRRALLGYAMVTAGRHAEAEAVYREAIALAPDVARLHADLATTLSRLGRLGDALAAARRAVQLEPATARLQMLLHGLCVSAGEHAEALATLRRAVELDPGKLDLKQRLTRMLAVAASNAEHGEAEPLRRRA